MNVSTARDVWIAAFAVGCLVCLPGAVAAQAHAGGFGEVVDRFAAGMMPSPQLASFAPEARNLPDTWQILGPDRTTLDSYIPVLFAPQDSAVVTPRWIWVGIAGGLTAAASIYGAARFARDGPIYFRAFDPRWAFIPGTVAIPVVTHWANGSQGQLGRAFLVSAGTMTGALFIPHAIVLLTPVIQVVTSTWIETATATDP